MSLLPLFLFLVFVVFGISPRGRLDFDGSGFETSEKKEVEPLRRPLRDLPRLSGPKHSSLFRAQPQPNLGAPLR